MEDGDGAGTDPTGTGQGQGTAPPAGESQGAGGKASGGDDVVPKTQFIAAINNVSRQLAESQAEARTLKEQLERALNPPKKPPTRDELDALVASGDLTRAQADKIHEDALTERAVAEAAARLAAENQARETANRVEANLAGYKELKPDAWVEGTPERARVAKEYGALIALGYPPTRATEAAALRAAFGDLDDLRASGATRRGPADTHSETGGGEPPGERSDGADGPPKGLTAREKEHYEALIRKGAYKDWKAVAEELKYANPALRRKHGAKA